jgi:hypothetical protein
MMTTSRTSKVGPSEAAPKLKRGRRVQMQFSPPRKVQSFMAAPRRRPVQVMWDPAGIVKRTT